MKRLLMLLSVASMIGMAAPAYADPDPAPAPNQDGSFLKEISDAGLTYKDGPQAVAAAKNICDMADKGTSESEIESKLQEFNSFSGAGAKKFIMLAANSYCPKQLYQDSPASDAPKPAQQ